MSTLPPGYRFRPTNKELLDFLKKKSMDQTLPCDVFIECEIYGANDKAPWQIFTDEDPWEICRTKDEKANLWKTKGTIYVFTSLIKGSGKKRPRTAGCGSWHGESALEQVLEIDKDNISLIGYKRILCFKISNEMGAIDRSVTKGHWIMHEYSLPDGGECSSKTCKAYSNEFGEEKNMDCHIVVAPKTQTKVAPFLEELLVQEQSFAMSNDPNELTVEEFEAIWEEQENAKTWLSAELLPSNHESEGFLSPNSMFHATAEPSSIFSFSNDLFLDQQKNNMSEHLPSIWW
ncbi:NAC transcription factor 29-like [Rhododendron vialii]|uniref:NAC transcription factor 29-like n=1 Tax=Rhododendron vialii TaxID=182163 RepID=UPI00265E501A|nr:NAC transcription factor 29-like [Rhododendron vialii]